MLTYLRKHSKGMLAYVAFGAIIVVFVLWGGSSYLSREANKVAKVDRTIISMEQYTKAYTDTVKQLQKQFQGALTPELIEKLDLRQKVLDDLIDQYIIESDARELGINVKDEDLRHFISQVSLFQKDGAFDETLYRRYLEYEGITPAQFEERARKDFIRKLFSSVITENLIVTAEEIEAAYHQMNDVYELGYIAVKPEAFLASADVSPEDARAYFEKNKEKYRSAARVTLSLIDFRVSRYLDKTDVGEQDAKDYYESHKQEFGEPASVRLRQILFRVPEGADETQRSGKMALAEKVLKEARVPQGDFGALAKTYSEDEATASKGGDMGTIPLAMLPKDVAETVGRMKPGDVAGPLVSQDAVRILKLEERREAKAPPFEAVSADVIEKLKVQRARITAHDDARKAFMDLYEQASPDLEAYAASRSLETRRVGPLSENELASFITQPEAARKAFTFAEKEVGEVVETPEGYAVYQVIRKELSRIPDLKEVEPRVTEDARADRALALARNHARDLAARGAASLESMNPTVTAPFSRSSSAVPGLESVSGLTASLDDLQNPKTFEAKGTVYVVWLRSKKVADRGALDPARAGEIRQDLLARKRELAMEEYLARAKDDKLGWHKVVVNQENLSGRREKHAGDTPPPEGLY